MMMSGRPGTGSLELGDTTENPACFIYMNSLNGDTENPACFTHVRVTVCGALRCVVVLLLSRHPSKETEGCAR